MKILCSLPGKYGDLLWMLPTVREISRSLWNGIWKVSRQDNDELHVGIMPQYRNLLPLLNAQSYIDKAFVIENWICTGSDAGDQPWEAPSNILVDGIYISTGINPINGACYHYDKVYHLGYRHHPSRNQPLVDFIAGQQGIQLTNPIPFIFVPSNSNSRSFVAYAFNAEMPEYKEPFIQRVKEELKDLEFIDISVLPWLNAATILSDKQCVAFIGCRSSNYVLACGVGKKIFVYEPNTSRSKSGMWGTTFTCPYADEMEVNSVEVVKDEIQKLLKEQITCA